MIAGLYIDGQSALHRAAAGAKILAMVALGTGVFLIPDWPVVGFVLATVILLYPASGFGPRIMWAQIKPILWLLVIFFAVQLWLNDWQAGLLVITRIAAIVMFAAHVDSACVVGAVGVRTWAGHRQLNSRWDCLRGWCPHVGGAMAIT